MLELGKRGFDVAWHGDVYQSGEIVPLQGEATIEGAGPIGGALVLIFEDCDQMVSIGGVGVFDPKSSTTSEKAIGLV
jgi:hypothetical protein